MPDDQGNYHFHPQGSHEKPMEFFREHYYKGQPGVCTGCEKEPEQRMNNNYSKKMDESRRTELGETTPKRMY